MATTTPSALFTFHGTAASLAASSELAPNVFGVDRATSSVQRAAQVRDPAVGVGVAAPPGTPAFVFNSPPSEAATLSPNSTFFFPRSPGYGIIAPASTASSTNAQTTFPFGVAQTPTIQPSLTTTSTSFGVDAATSSTDTAAPVRDNPVAADVAALPGTPANASICFNGTAANFAYSSVFSPAAFGVDRASSSSEIAALPGTPAPVSNSLTAEAATTSPISTALIPYAGTAVPSTTTPTATPHPACYVDIPVGNTNDKKELRLRLAYEIVDLLHRKVFLFHL